MIVADATSTCVLYCRESSNHPENSAVGRDHNGDAASFPQQQLLLQQQQPAVATMPRAALVDPRGPLAAPSSRSPLLTEAESDKASASKDAKESLRMQRITLAGELSKAMRPRPARAKNILPPIRPASSSPPRPSSAPVDPPLKLDAILRFSAESFVEKKAPLVSALRAPSRGGAYGCHKPRGGCSTTAKKGGIHPTSPTERRVRGLWNPQCSCHFSQLHDDMLLFVLSHLSLLDVCRASGVCRRWRYVTGLDQAWRTVDATDFVYRVFDRSVSSLTRSPAKVAAATAPAERTSHALESHLKRRRPESLTLKHVEHRLLPSVFLPQCHGLQELIITGYADLNDTHVHAMLLSSTLWSFPQQEQAAAGGPNYRRHGGNCLRKLVLEDCPLLTNASVRSIALTCHHLEELSVRGNRQIDSILPLQGFWRMPEENSLRSPYRTLESPCDRYHSPLPPQSTPAPTSTLSALFAPPPPSAVAPTPSLSLIQPPPNDRSSSAILPSPCSGGGRLVRLNVSGTGISPSALVEAIRGVRSVSSRTIPTPQLQSLICSGRGELWHTAHFKSLCRSLDVSVLQVLDLGCSNPYLGATHLTSLDALLGGGSSPSSPSSSSSSPSMRLLPELQRLTLSGHAALTANTVAQVCRHAPRLQEMNLDGCCGLGDSSEADWRELGRALAASSSLTHLSLARCFPGPRQHRQRAAAAQPLLLKEDERRAQAFFTALRSSQSGASAKLRVLDVSGWWLLTQDDESFLRESFPFLFTLHLSNTRCAKGTH